MDLNILILSLNDEERKELLEILLSNKPKLTPVTDFCLNNKHKMSVRLRNCLMDNRSNINKYFELIDIDNFKNMRNVGRKTIIELRNLLNETNTKTVD